MFRRLRHKLRLIDYHSAQRERTVWSRATDVALFVTLVMALPLTWLMDVAVVREHEAAFLSGAIGRRPGGVLHAEVIDDTTLARMWTQGSQMGNFELVLVNEHRGWPVTTSIRRPATKLNMNLFEWLKPNQKDVDIAGVDPTLRAAIDQAVDESTHDEVRARWGAAVPGVERFVWGWLGSAILWWLLLFFGSAIVIQMLRLAAAWREARGAKRARRLAREGLCPACGYNLTGLEWSERCPECGELAE
jgi:hypothetical protein